MSFTLFPMVELHSVATLELKCLFAMVNRIKYTPIADIVDCIKNVHKMSGPINCTSMVTRIAVNLGCPEMANLGYIEGDIPVLGLDHFVHTHILHDEPDHSLSMLYGHKVIRLPNSGLRLYSCESLTLQFDWMGEVHHSFTGPPHIAGELVWRQHSRQQLHHRLTLRSPLGTGYGGGYSGHHEGGSYYPSHGYPEPEPPPLPGTVTGTPLRSGTSIMGLTRLSARWKGSDYSSIGWLTLHTCKQRCKPPSIHRPA
jgi:hypothetical protein